MGNCVYKGECIDYEQQNNNQETLLENLQLGKCYNFFETD